MASSHRMKVNFFIFLNSLQERLVTAGSYIFTTKSITKSITSIYQTSWKVIFGTRDVPHRTPMSTTLAKTAAKRH